jgi:release factor glutamine methyltransferase
VKVLEAIQRGTEFLAGKGIDAPRLHAEQLVAHVLGVPRLKMYLQFDRVLDEAQVAAARELLRRRGLREPLQHLLGTVEFCGLDLRVGPDALIPRPETELLAERAWQWLGACGNAAPQALDFGTGTGCLAIALAVHCASARVWALDISAAALALARANAARCGVADRVRFCEGDGFLALGNSEDERFDMVVSNPPYIPSGEIDALQPEVRDHDPRLALDGGPDGLEFYRRLAEQGGRWLRPGGVLMAELGDGQAAAATKLFESHKWVVEGVDADYSGRARMLRARPAVR